MAMNDKKQQGDQRTEGDLQEKLVQVNRVAKTVGRPHHELYGADRGR